MSLAQPASGFPDLGGLVARVAQREVNVFEELYALTVTRVYGAIRRVLLDRALSEDAAQDVYVLIWFNAHKYDPGAGSPMTWLLMMAHRRAVDRVHSEQPFMDRNLKYEMRSGHHEHDPAPELVDRLAAAGNNFRESTKGPGRNDVT
ncbi:sigma factor [Arthrobacter sp. H14]|uniref:sigma factor n=1 Tax=Arthrobacter sp. H14 TaxID=1312959 RepID=UPI000685F8FE|nr:sigma factor [Arthrobacter sp. H14]